MRGALLSAGIWPSQEAGADSPWLLIIPWLGGGRCLSLQMHELPNGATSLWLMEKLKPVPSLQ